MNIITAVYNFLWGDLITLPLPGGSSVGLSRSGASSGPGRDLFYDPHPVCPDPQVSSYAEDRHGEKRTFSGGQYFRSAGSDRCHRHPCRHGDLVGVVAAILPAVPVRYSGCGFLPARFFHCFAEARCSDLPPEGSALRRLPRRSCYYIHDLVEDHLKKKKRYVLPAVLFAIAGLICWCGISQVISNSVASSFKMHFPFRRFTPVSCW